MLFRSITEWNYCYPNPHNFEGPFLAAAYSALQNYNGLWQFTFSHAAKTEEPKTLGAFDYHSNPVMKLAARAGALFFLRGDVKPSGISVAVTEKGRQLFRARLPLAVRTGQFNPEAAAAANTLAATEEEPPPANAPAILRAKNEQQLVESLEKAGIMPKGCINFESGAVASSTGELFLNPKEQLFRVRTPRSEALILKGKASGKSDVLAVANGNADAAFFAGSLDGKPLKQSGRLQILHLTDLKSEGAVFRDPSMSVQEEAGTNRFLLRRNTATVELNHPGTCTIYACAPNGKRLFEVPFERNGDILKFTADNGSTQGCVILYELVNQQTENKK